MNPPSFRAIVVEDDRSWQQILSEILTDSGLDVEVTSNLDDAVLALKDQPHRLAVVDLSLSPDDHNNNDGLRVLDAVRRLDPNCRTILLTGFATVELAVTALTDYGAYTFLRKENFYRGQFREMINRVLASAPQPVLQKTSALSPIENSIQAKTAASTAQPELITEKAMIVEDDAGWRSIIEELLVDSGFQVRACSSFGEALGYLRREKFSLAVVDLSLNGTVASLWDQKFASENLEGYQLLNSTRAANIPTIIVSGVASTEDIQRTYAEQSIFAFLEKQSFDRISFKRIVTEAKNSHHDKSELNILTDREREVLDLLAKGMTNKEIAEKLFITTNTVKRHLKAVFEKLDVHTRSAAAAKALGEK
jgi:two-component system, NarL family, nitrate/nitrite response regulator NarP